MPETRMDIAFLDGLVVILGPFFRFPLYFPLLLGETRSQLTASTATLQNTAAHRLFPPRGARVVAFQMLNEFVHGNV